MIDAQAENKRAHARSSADSGWIMAGLALVAFVLIAQLVWALRLFRARAIEPLAATADTMTRMAAGDVDADEKTQHGTDEIGTMTRSIEVFRAASRKQRADAQEQRTVVETLSEALSHLANGRLDHSIEQSFASEYEPLRIAFNSTLAQLGELIERVTSSVQGVRVGASEILAATDDLAQRNQIQAGRVEEAAAAMRVVTEDVNRSAMQTRRRGQI